MSTYDLIIKRLQAITPFNIYQVNEDGTVEPWYEVTSDQLMNDLVLADRDILTQVQTVANQVAHWGRLEAQCKRVWDIAEREYRTWRDGMYLQFLRGAEKKTTQKEIDAMIRTHPSYSLYYNRIERAEEAYNAATAVYKAWSVKKEMIGKAVYRQKDELGGKLSI